METPVSQTMKEEAACVSLSSVEGHSPFPLAVMPKILENLNYKDLMQVPRVCKSWYQAFQQAHVSSNPANRATQLLQMISPRRAEATLPHNAERRRVSYGELLRSPALIPHEAWPLLPNFLALERSSASVMKDILTLTVDFLHRTKSLEKSLSSLSPEEQLKCLKLFLPLYSEELIACANDNVLSVHWKPSNPLLHVVFHLVYHGLLSKEYAPQTILEICAYTQGQGQREKWGAILSMLYCLFSYLSEKRGELLSPGKDQEQFDAQITQVLTQLQENLPPQVVGSIVRFVQHKCSTVKLVHHFDSIKYENSQTEAVIDVLCNPADFGEQAKSWTKQVNWTEEQKNYLTQIIEGAVRNWDEILTFTQRHEPQDRAAILANLCGQNGSTLIHWEVRENIVPFVSSLAIKVMFQDDMPCDPFQVVKIVVMVKRLVNTINWTTMPSCAQEIANDVINRKVPDAWFRYVIETLSSKEPRAIEHLDVALDILSRVVQFTEFSFGPPLYLRHFLYPLLLERLGEKVKPFIYFSLLAPEGSSSSEMLLGCLLDNENTNDAFIGKLGHVRNYLEQMLAPESKQQFTQESVRKYITSIEAILQKKTSKRAAFLKAKNQLEAVITHILNRKERILKTEFLLEHVALRLWWTQEVVKMKQQLADGEMTSNGVEASAAAEGEVETHRMTLGEILTARKGEDIEASLHELESLREDLEKRIQTLHARGSQPPVSTLLKRLVVVELFRAFLELLL